MPLVTVAMPAFNAAAFIVQAIASVQQQTDIDWELIVVDDGSTDETADLVRAIDDPRIRLVCNETRRGIGYSHNRVLAVATAPFVAHLDADDFILPGALRKMVEALQNNPRTGQAYCQFYDVDSNGNVLREILVQRNRMYQRRMQGIDYRRALVAVGTVTSGLRTYPRHVLETLGGFNETLSFGIDYDMVLRIVEHYEIAFVPQYLYVRRMHTHNTTEAVTFKRWRFFCQHYQICRALDRSRSVTYWNQEPYNLNRLLLRSLADTLGLSRVQAFVLEKILRLPRNLLAFSHAKIVLPMLYALYQFAVNHGAWWRLHWLPRRPQSSVPKRLGYYLWRFPVLSQTFIRREIQALRDAGIPIEIFSDERGGLDDAALIKTTHYFLPRDPKRTARAKCFFARRHRFRYWNVFLYTVLHRYGEYKTPHEDIIVFERAVELAACLRDNNVTHLHAPWADRTAFIALLAAALLEIPYSVEARAHELHRFRFQYALREKFMNAEFIITNSDYNARVIARYFDSSTHPPLHVLRELLPSDQFSPPMRHASSGPFRILCVARLIQEKGLIYLLHACAQVRAYGLPFQCEIIGAPEEPAYTSYLIELKRLYKQLHLQDSVSFLGAQPFEKILDAYARADLFVLPCVRAQDGGSDISPNALIEAMGMGLPVISTELSAIPEIVEHAVSGILVPPNDSKALANAIIALMQNERLRRELGARARERIQKEYDAARNVSHYVTLFVSAAQ